MSIVAKKRGPHSEETKKKMSISYKKSIRKPYKRRPETKEQKKKRIKKSKATWKKRKKLGQTNKGKTLEEIYGSKRGKLIREKGGTNLHKSNCTCCVCKVQRGETLGCSFLGVMFDSKSEQKVAKLLFKYFGFIPINFVNSHVKINSKTVDFYFLGCFIEYHPGMRFPGKILKEKNYYKKRRNMLNTNGFKNTPLIQLKNLTETRKIIKFLNVAIN